MIVPSLRKRFTAFVVFKGSENRRFWRIFTRRGWRHVYVIIPAYYPEPGLTAVAYSQVLNFWTDHVRADVVFMHPRAIAETELREGATAVITLPVDQKFSGRYLPRGLFTCVSMVKALIGCNAWFVWTPEQLARWMLRNGGEVMEKPQDDTAFRRQAQGRQEVAASADGGAAAARSVHSAANGR